MATTKAQLTIRGSVEMKEDFRDSFEASTANSQGEFQQMLLDKWNQEDPAPLVHEKTVYKEKELETNQLLFNLDPIQNYALRQVVLSTPDFAQRQNQIIDKLKGSSPLFYFGNLYDPEFSKLWIRSIVLKKEMTPEERENAIKHNMAAFVLNMFIMHAIEGNMATENVNATSIKAFIRKTSQKSVTTKKDVSNESE